jgi:hypothetical protein
MDISFEKHNVYGIVPAIAGWNIGSYDVDVYQGKQKDTELPSPFFGTIGNHPAGCC